MSSATFSGQGYGQAATAGASMNQPPSAPLRQQLSLIADNLANSLEQVTRIEDAVQSLAQITGSGQAPAMPSPNTIEGLVHLLNDRVLMIATRLGRLADKL